MYQDFHSSVRSQVRDAYLPVVPADHSFAAVTGWAILAHSVADSVPRAFPLQEIEIGILHTLTTLKNNTTALFPSVGAVVRVCLAINAMEASGGEISGGNICFRSTDSLRRKSERSRKMVFQTWSGMELSGSG
jgi:hypothetical protein